MIGDGTYLMNPTELVTAVQEGLKITVVISENHGYQCIRRLQMWRPGALRQRVPGQPAPNERLQGDYVRLDLGKVAEGWARASSAPRPPRRPPRRSRRRATCTARR